MTLNEEAAYLIGGAFVDWLADKTVGLTLFLPRYFAVKTPIIDSQYFPCNQSDTPGSGSDNPLVETPIDDSRYGPRNQSDTRE